MEEMGEEASAPLKPIASKLRTINRASYIDQRAMESHGLRRFYLIWRRKTLRYYFVRPPLSRVLLRAALSGDRMTPAFASLGAVRSGTSLLADYLLQHPCVLLPLAKEIGLRFPTKRLFVAQFPTRRAQRRIEAKYGSGRAMTGYCAPMMPYLTFSHFAVELAPEVRFILLLRDPVERTFAHWRWDQVLLSRVRRDPLWRRFPDFSECVQLELEAMRSHGAGMVPASGVGAGGYIQHSIYLPFINNLLRFFDRDKMLIINSRDFFADPSRVAKLAYQFLGLPDYEPVAMPVKNAAPAGTMTEETRQALRDFFDPLNRELYQVLGCDLGWQ